MRAVDLTPRDSLPPRVLAVDRPAPVLSPNGDSVADTTQSGPRSRSRRPGASASVTTTVRRLRVDRTGQRTGGNVDGLVAGTPVAEGTYSYRIDATDGWSNASYKTGTVRVDLLAETHRRDTRRRRRYIDRPER